jgi:hypothetical protein
MDITMQTPLEDETELTGALQQALQAGYQSQQTYAAAARSAPSAEFTILFATLADEREQAMHALQQSLLLLVGEGDSNILVSGPVASVLPAENGTNGTNGTNGANGANGANGTQQTDTLRHRLALLEACEQQERRVLEQYERLLLMDLPAEIAALVRQQHGQVIAALHSIGTWKPF